MRKDFEKRSKENLNCSLCEKRYQCKLVEQGFPEICEKNSNKRNKTKSEIAPKKSNLSKKQSNPNHFRTGRIYKVKIVEKTRFGLGVAKKMNSRIYVENYIGMKIGDEIKIQIIQNNNNNNIHAKKVNPEAKTPIKKRQVLVPNIPNTTSEGELIASSPWVDSQGKRNKNGTFSYKKCNACGGRCSWDSSQNNYFCEKCGFEN
ncbi:hypothetical protein [Methanococcoides sp. NM1]|uniref:hypothetical protein n=1 Tax=Methanococcoides sp. NM1 TaxID=1201013 RepID=UPI0010845D61|nr:hypothetical protein [Methanococcoides sp. NM1]